MARIRKRLIAKTLVKEELSTYRKVRKEVLDVNKMLSALEKVYNTPTYAVSQLQSKLTKKSINIYNKSTGRLNIPAKTLNKGQIRVLLNAIEDFKKSKTSTVRGVKSLSKVQRQELLKRSDNAEWVNDLSDDEVEALHKVFDDKDYEAAMYGLDSDTAYQLMIDAKEYKMNKKDFTDVVIKYSQSGTDLKRRKIIEGIYTKYLK